MGESADQPATAPRWSTRRRVLTGLAALVAAAIPAAVIIGESPPRHPVAGLAAAGPHAESASADPLALGGPFTAPRPGPPTTTPPNTPEPSPARPGAAHAPQPAPHRPGTADLALHKAVTASGSTQTYLPGNAVDGDPDTYWESTDNAFPQSFTLDLGAPVSIGRIVLGVPPLPDWLARTQTIQIQGSGTDGSWFTIAGTQGYTFDPAAGNVVTIQLSAVVTRFVRFVFTANPDWPAGQLSVVRVYAA
ncbi:MAG TPA: discoidin domain-containing protein [Pseudonocardiaceae bacterium]|nr:discoidin domain-containing protein [Pseudonocardiaceae bacterium]